MKGLFLFIAYLPVIIDDFCYFAFIGTISDYYGTISGYNL